MIGIYKITNTITGLCYIGQSIDIQDRWIRHAYNATHEVAREKGRKLYEAFHEYGLSNFNFEIIEECNLSQNTLNTQERYWIEYYDSYNNGYNMTKGGQGEDSWIYDPAMIQQLWDEGCSVAEIREIVGCSKGIVQKRLKGYKDYNSSTSHSRGLLYGIQKKHFPQIALSTSYNFSDAQKFHFYANIPVHQYTLDGIYVASYPSLSAAARALGKNKPGNETNISHALHGARGQRIAYNYQWSTEKVESLSPVPAHVGKLVRCIETGQIFSSSVEAAKWAGLKSSSNIKDCCRGYRCSSAGKHPETGEKLHWEYID